MPLANICSEKTVDPTIHVEVVVTGIGDLGNGEVVQPIGEVVQLIDEVVQPIDVVDQLIGVVDQQIGQMGQPMDIMDLSIRVIFLQVDVAAPSIEEVAQSSGVVTDPKVKKEFPDMTRFRTVQNSPGEENQWKERRAQQVWTLKC